MLKFKKIPKMPVWQAKVGPVFQVSLCLISTDRLAKRLPKSKWLWEYQIGIKGRSFFDPGYEKSREKALLMAVLQLEGTLRQGILLLDTALWPARYKAVAANLEKALNAPKIIDLVKAKRRKKP